MNVITTRCQVCGKSFIVTGVNKDFSKILKNPTYPFHCESCAQRIQFEARQQKYSEIFRSDNSACFLQEEIPN